MGQLSGFANRLHGPGFVIGKHQADQGRFVTQRRFELVEPNPSFVIDPNLGECPAISLECA